MVRASRSRTNQVGEGASRGWSTVAAAQGAQDNRGQHVPCRAARHLKGEIGVDASRLTTWRALFEVERTAQGDTSAFVAVAPEAVLDIEFDGAIGVAAGPPVGPVQPHDLVRDRVDASRLLAVPRLDWQRTA